MASPVSPMCKETHLRRLLSWPGKSADGDGVEHPALWHMLDVAAVAEQLLEPLGLSRAQRDMLVLLVALHDLGKISASFRDMIRKGRPQTAGRHWEVTEVWLRHFDGQLEDRLPKRWQQRYMLYAAVAGHHGRPPTKDIEDDAGRAMARTAGPDAEADALACLNLLAGLWPAAELADFDRARTVALSWWLPGLIAAADWIGSNTEWFPARAFDGAPEDYLRETRDRALRAVAAAGLGGATAASGQLFPFALRPMQQAATRVDLPDGQTLAILEDETGSGKTEAALLLAQRLLSAGKGQGLFFALPTMATADAMFGRMAAAIRPMFGAPPTLALAHGRASLSKAFRTLPDIATAPGEEVGTTDWLRDDRRRCLLATVGIGTIDQALLSVLKTRHSTLRHYALSSKILIVDEVHELGEPYMAEELTHLLRAHAVAGGSAILMTATLPLDLRARLVVAFEEGAGRNHQDDGNAAYPALTVIGGGTARLPARPSERGPVVVKRLATSEEAIDLLEARTRAGAACVWVRNAVDDVVAGAAQLRARGLAVDILHARFALTDRKRHEAAVLSRYGKTRDGGAGRILVASQVLEMSLDCDFDVMISDLAPMAALIQRAGRLWRHMDLRSRMDRPEPMATLHVISPDPNNVRDAAWLREVLDRGAWTYGVATQWRTARTLFDTGVIDAPGGLRALIEAVHGAVPIPVPEALLAAENEAMGEGNAHRQHALHNLIEWSHGYRKGGRGEDDANYPTRLSREERTLALARFGLEGLEAWAGGQSTEAWMLSEVRASEAKLRGMDLPDQTVPAIAMLTADWPEWRRASLTVCPVGEDGTICKGLRYDAEQGLLFVPATR